MMHFCGEVRLNHWYRRASEWRHRPLIKHIYGLIAKDEARHAGAYLKYQSRRSPAPRPTRSTRSRRALPRSAS